MNTRLKTWKQIAAFFGTTKRTAMRWEAERGLPVHRMPGELRSSVYADVEELKAWQSDTKAAALEDLSVDSLPVSTPPPVRRRIWLWPTVASAGVVCAVIGTGAFVNALPRQNHIAPAAAQTLYVEAMQDWNARTPASLNQAVDEFNKAIAIDPDYADAYVGLANSYNLLPEYTVMPRSQAFPLAEAAAQKAIDLDDRLASAHAALAYSVFYGDWNGKLADQEFAKAIALEPENATIQHWYGTFLHALGREPEALAHLDKALALNPSSLSVQADRALILYYNGRTREAETLLLDLARKNPDFRSPHFYLTQVYLPEGRDADYVRELRLTATLAGDLLDQGVAQAAEAGLKKAGHEGMLQAVLARRLDYFKSGAGSPYEIAVFYSLLGYRDDAVAYLKVALDRHDDGIINAPSERRLNTIKNTATYRSILKRLDA